MLCLMLTLMGGSAAADEAPRELAAETGAIQVQQGEVLVFGTEMRVEQRFVKIPAGVFYTMPGHQRLTAAFMQLQADKLTSDARADALQQAISLRTNTASQPSTVVVMLVAAALLVGGGVAGYVLASSR